MFEHRPHDHAAEALEDSVIVAVEVEAFERALAGSPELVQRTVKLLMTRLQRLYGRTRTLLATRDASARIAGALLDVAAEHGIADTDGILIPIRLTQRELGGLVGFSRETANVVLQALRRRGLIEMDTYGIRLRNAAVLRAMDRGAADEVAPRFHKAALPPSGPDSPEAVTGAELRRLH